MKKLFENWRAHAKENLSIEEAANLDFKKYALIPLKLMDQEHVLVLVDAEKWVESLKKLQKIAVTQIEVGDFQEHLIEEIIKGTLWIEPSSYVRKGRCYSIGGRSVWEIVSSAAVEKLGPMLYDFALQFAKRQRAPGVIADRTTVSSLAAGIYNKWHSSGRGATGIVVQAARMDNEKDPKTPPEEDDCPMTPAYAPGEPVNYVYSTPSASKEFAVAMSRGRQLINLTAKKYGISVQHLDDALEIEAHDFFREEYSKI